MRGELVHHYGIFHCLVDDLFQEYSRKWIKTKMSDYYLKKQCPYEDYFFTDETDFLTHLTTAHYFNAILSEVQDMVKFSLTYFEQYKCMANLYKCPFCKKKFKNLDNGSNVRDVKEMVIHCGVQHGFSYYYLQVFMIFYIQDAMTMTCSWFGQILQNFSLIKFGLTKKCDTTVSVEHSGLIF